MEFDTLYQELRNSTEINQHLAFRDFTGGSPIQAHARSLGRSLK